MLALLGVFVCVWRNTLAVLYVRDWLAIPEAACWALLAIFECIILLSFVCASVRRWQDLDIRIPVHESVWSVIQRPRFWQVLATAEGSVEKNQHGDAPSDNPVPIVSADEMKDTVQRHSFQAELDGIDQIK